MTAGISSSDGISFPERRDLVDEVTDPDAQSRLAPGPGRPAAAAGGSPFAAARFAKGAGAPASIAR